MQIWTLFDIGVLLIFALCVLHGLRRGFMRAAYHILSIAATIVIVMMFQQTAANFLSTTQIGTMIKEKVDESVNIVMKNQKSNKSLSDIASGMGLPSFMAKGIEEQSKTIENTKDSVAKVASENIAEAVMGIVSAALLFMAVRFALWLLLMILDAVFKLPVLNFVNKSAGAVVGIINALLIIYVLCALIMLVTPVDKMTQMNEIMEKTVFAKHFYENNLLMEVFI
ncbi:MAG: CvpA family protein [Clostridia bacterium]|nr:CvpA family protein [Clostridia bacterium]